MVATMPVALFRKELAEVLNQVAYKDERVIITRQGKPVAALVPIHSAQVLQRLLRLLDEDKLLGVLEREADTTDLTEEEFVRRLGI